MDRRATLLSIMLPPLVAAGFILGFYVAEARFTRRIEGDPSGKVREVAVRVADRYFGPVSPEKVERAAVDGMLGTLDPYCQYFSVAEWKDFNETNMEGKFGGIGVYIETDPPSGFIRVQSPIEGTPAYEVDIIPGDLIVEIDGKTTKGISIDEMKQRIRGPIGSKMKLSLVRSGGEPFAVEVARAEITSRVIHEKTLADGLGYVRVTDFTRMIEQFDDALGRLKERGMKGLVVDLRFNHGGLLKASADLVDRFLPAGKLIVSTKGKLKDDCTEYMTKNDGHDLDDIPVVLLVNGETASASEIVAGALRDHGRAKLVGARTYGKGLVQTPMGLSDGSHVKLTTAHYFTPSGASVQRIPGTKEFGLEPDYLVEMTEQEYNAVKRQWREEQVVKRPPSLPMPKLDARDYQLDAAVEILKASIAKREPKVDRRELGTLGKKDEPVK